MNYSGIPSISNGHGRRYDYEDGSEYGRGGGGNSSGFSSNKHQKKGGHTNDSSSESRYGNTHHSSHHSSYDNESRANSLSQQLSAAQSQVLRLETELSNLRTAKTHAEHSMINLQRDYGQLQKRNAEVVDVMKTLEIGVEALQREKNVIGVERDELKAKLEASEKNAAVLNQQVTYLNERNSTLSKKCVDLLEGSKEYKEKASASEEELQRIKPRFEEMDANFGALSEQNKNFSTRLSMFEMRERIWIREKTELEEGQKIAIENMQKIIVDIRQKHEMEKAVLIRAANGQNRGGFSFQGVSPQIQLSMPMPSPIPQISIKTPNGPSNEEMEKMEQQIKDFRQLLESVQQHHNAELVRYMRRIEQLEQIAADKQQQSISKQQQDNSPTTADDGDEGKEIDQQRQADHPVQPSTRSSPSDDEIILLDDSPPATNSGTAAAAADGPTQNSTDNTPKKNAG